jgi:peptide/nickel transport system substrate-binding protein
MLNVLLDGRTIVASGNTNNSYFDQPTFNARLDAAGRLSGAARYRAYGQLDVDLARDAAPLVAYALLPVNELFSARIGCQVFQPSYLRMDLAGLCIRRESAADAVRRRGTS